MDQNTSAPVPQVVAKIGLDTLKKLFKDSWEIYKTQFLKLVVVAFIPGILGFLAASGMGYLGLKGTTLALPVFAGFMLLAFVVVVIASVWSQIALVTMVSDTKGAGILEVVKGSSKNIIPYFWVSALASLVSIAGFTLFILPGIFFSTALLFAAFFLVNENMRGRDALAHSYTYMMGYWWPVFGRLVLLMITLIAFSSVVGFVFGKANQDIVSFAVNVVTMPFVIAYIFTLYKNIKAVVSAPTAEVLEKKKAMLGYFALFGVVASILWIVGLLMLALWFAPVASY